MSTVTPRTETVQITVDLSASVMTATCQEHLASLAGYISEARGTLLVRPAGGGRWSGSVQFTDDSGYSYEAVGGDSVESVLAQLRSRIGA